MHTPLNRQKQKSKKSEKKIIREKKKIKKNIVKAVLVVWVGI